MLSASSLSSPGYNALLRVLRIVLSMLLSTQPEGTVWYLHQKSSPPVKGLCACHHLFKMNRNPHLHVLDASDVNSCELSLDPPLMAVSWH